jgi:hypothetical protein
MSNIFKGPKNPSPPCPCYSILVVSVLFEICTPVCYYNLTIFKIICHLKKYLNI